MLDFWVFVYAEIEGVWEDGSLKNGSCTFGFLVAMDLSIGQN